MNGRLLIVDDERAVCWSLERAFATAGLEVQVVGSAEDAVRRLKNFAPDVALVDIRLPGSDGFAFLEYLKSTTPTTQAIAMTAHGSLDYAVDALRAGAVDYLPKPFDLSVAMTTVQRLLQKQEPALQTRSDFDENAMVGSSSVMQAVFRRIAIAAHSTVPVLISGETGVGKDLVAKAIHRHGPRAKQPFVAVHLASLNESVVESELFGRARGAYTGSGEARAGLFELADGGTLFLDEIGEAPPNLQTKLLRAVEQQEIWPVGGDSSKKLDVRIVAATNRNLRASLGEGRFRADLYYRLNGIEIHVPPLRARREDIPQLVAHFAVAFGRSGVEIDERVAAHLQSHAWPGNARELRHAVGHAIAMARGSKLSAEHFPAVDASASGVQSEVEQLAASIERFLDRRLASDLGHDLYRELTAIFDAALLTHTLQATRGNRALAARLLGLDRATLRKKLSNLNIAVDPKAETID